MPPALWFFIPKETQSTVIYKQSEVRTKNPLKFPFLVYQEIEQKISKKQLKIKNQIYVASLIDLYRTRMMALVDPDLKALHFLHLQDKHEEALENVRNEFRSKGDFGEGIEQMNEYVDTIVEVRERLILLYRVVEGY